MVLSHGLWERRYGADPGIIGKMLEMDGAPLTIVGVMPSGFALHLPPDAGVPPYLDAWVPWGGGYEESPRSFRVLTAIGRARLRSRSSFSPAAAFFSAGSQAFCSA